MTVGQSNGIGSLHPSIDSLSNSDTERAARERDSAWGLEFDIITWPGAQYLSLCVWCKWHWTWIWSAQGQDMDVCFQQGWKCEKLETLKGSIFTMYRSVNSTEQRLDLVMRHMYLKDLYESPPLFGFRWAKATKNSAGKCGNCACCDSTTK